MLALAGGVALSTERAAWIGGPRLHVVRRFGYVAARADYRPGRAWKGYRNREARFAIELGLDGRRRADGGIALGVELWLGQTQSAAGLAPRDRALRGDYVVALGSLERRW